MSDVARLAGVSRVTASVVLNNNTRARTRVSEETRRRILAAAAALRYRPNAIARSLRDRVTNTIGFYSGSHYVEADVPFMAQLLAGLERGCGRLRKDLLLHRSYVGRTPEAIYAELASGKVDGLVCFARADDPLLEQFITSHLPAVVIADPIPGLPAVVVDDATGGRLQAAHLAERGHRWVDCQPVRDEPASVRVRVSAFCEAARELGLEVIRDAEADLDGGLGERGQALLRGPARERPTALVAWSDCCAYRMLAICRALGLRVPEDVAVVGFDGIPQPVEPLRRLTTIRAPWKQVAETAVELLNERLAGRPIPEVTVLPVELAIGDTT